MMTFTKGSNTRDLLSSPNMPHEINEASFQSAARPFVRGAVIPVFT